MENATHAMIMAFSVLVFVIALTVSITAFTTAKTTADTILYMQDETNYYEYIGAKGKTEENRVVGLETIIPTLYKYYKEDFTIVFKKGYYNSQGYFSSWTYMPIYTTKTNRNWQSSYKTLCDKKYGTNNYNSFAQYGKIFSFDLDEEILRHEPWSGSDDEKKKNIDAFLNGDIYYNPATQIEYIKYSGFINFCNTRNAQFIETVSIYTPTGVQDEEEDEYVEKHSSSLTKEKTKRVVTFTLIN